MNRGRITLTVLLALAFVLRTWGIHYGLPWLFYFHDEPQIVLRALRFGTGDFNPHFFIWPATLLLYLAFLADAGLFVFGRIAGWWTGKAGFAAAYFRDPTAFYLLPRLESVGFGLWSVWLANGLGAAAYGAPVGLAAAVGLTLNALAAHYAHLAHPVTAMTAFTLLGLWAAVRLADGGGTREMIVGALALGFGTATQYHAGLLAIPLGVAVLIRAVLEPRRAPLWIARGLAIGLGGLLVFALVVPYAWLDFATFRADLSWITAKTEGGSVGLAPRGAVDGLVEFVRTCLVPALGGPLAIAAAVGTLWAIVRRTWADLVLLAFAAGYLALASRAGSLNDRYAIPLVVPAALFAARAIASLVAGAGLGARARAWLPAVALVLLCGPVAFTLVETDLTMTRGDTRVEALRWFERNVPADSRVVLDMLRFWNTATAPLAENRVRLAARIAEVQAGLSGGGHSSAYLDYYRYRYEHPVAPAYDLRGTEMGIDVRSLAAYRAAGYRWAMTSEEVAAPMRARPAPADSSGPAFYRALERECPRVATFVPRRWQALGPEIRVYRLDSLATVLAR